jgi:hypothetical protein
MLSRFIKISAWLVAGALIATCASAQTPRRRTAGTSLPRLADGKPNLQGIWQAHTRASYDLLDHAASAGMPAGKGVVEGNEIPYLPAAAVKRAQNFARRTTADPLAKCFFPGVPRIMYMDFPFQVFQTAANVSMAFEWSQVYRMIYTDGKPLMHPTEAWMGNSVGKWEGDTLVVTVTEHNDKTWFDMAGNFHSDALKVSERYTLSGPDTMQYEATIEDPKTFSKPWKLRVEFQRQKNMDRLLEYQCQAEAEEVSGDFERDPRTWYAGPGGPESPLGKPAVFPAVAPVADPKPGATITRMADGKPNISGYFEPNGGGANYGLEKHDRDFLTPASRGVVVDPVDGKLPYLAWARAERIERELPHRGYDDPTAHCFAAGVPRGIYTPSPFQIVQAPGYVVILFERMSWRIIPIVEASSTRKHIPDHIRLWQGDSIGHWEGDVLVIDTTNLNGKTWLNEVGDVLTQAAHVTERFIPIDATKVTYRATVSDAAAFTRPWTIEIPLAKQAEQLLEVACHEDNGDLHHLKDVRDEYRAQQKAKQK